MFAVAALTLVVASFAFAQAPRSSPPAPQLPQTFFSSELPIRVVPVATGLSHPWSLAFPARRQTCSSPSAKAVCESSATACSIRRRSPGRRRCSRACSPVCSTSRCTRGSRRTSVIYLSYSKAGENNLTTTALARARFDGTALKDVKDIFVANTWSKSNTNYGGRIAFDRAGLLYLTVGERQEQDRAQKPGDHGGKVLRLRDDGSVPPDNPFVGKPGYLPEIYSLGHRSPQGLAMNPATGAIWENEHGPLGGDELNIIQAGKNYGWPLVTFGTDYDGTKISDSTWRADLEAPFVYWVPSIAISGLTFYTGDRFPAWKGNVFVGAMFQGRTRGTGHIQRIVINEAGRPINREPMLTELRQRIRDVRQGPDGLLYVLTDEDAGMLLRIEPGN